MSKQTFYQVLKQELARVDKASTGKRLEKVIEGFSKDAAPRALIEGKEFRIFNSNDYLGLRFHPALKEAEAAASERFGTGPGAVRFISGTLKVHQELEKALAEFHGREAAMVFSSAFAANLAVLFSLITGQSKDSLVGNEVLVVSDGLNHRSIIDGIRVANHPREARVIVRHMDTQDLEEKLRAGVGKFKRAMVVTDGVFSMLGEYQDLRAVRKVMEKFETLYEQGVLLFVDDAHGIGAFGDTGRGTEEVSRGRAEVLVGTLGKALGADGGYVVADQVVVDYLRESAATYIYSNSIAPGTAGAGVAAVKLLMGAEGQKRLEQSRKNVGLFQDLMADAGYEFATDSIHPIQPILMGDAKSASRLAQALYEQGFLVTTISYPVVPPGRDEIRVQISAAHTPEDIADFARACKRAKRK